MLPNHYYYSDTCTVDLKYSTNEIITFIVIFSLEVIIEEAAEILEAHVVATLTSSCEHLIMIGEGWCLDKLQ